MRIWGRGFGRDERNLLASGAKVLAKSSSLRLLLKVTHKSYAGLRVLARRSGFTSCSVGRAFADSVRNHVGRLIYGITGIGRRMPADVRGLRMYLPDRPPLHMLLGHYEEDVTEVLESLLTPGMTFVDVGAHAGYFTLLARRLISTRGKVYAFEPAPENFALLRRNLELNGFHDVTVFQKAVADRTGTAEFFLSDRESGWHSIYPTVNGASRCARVEVTTLDDAFTAQGWPRIDVVKIDAEGAEYAVLSGMRRLLEQRNPLHLIMEINAGTLTAAGIDPGAVVAQLQGLGFNVSALRHVRGKTAPDPTTPPIRPTEVFNILAVRGAEAPALFG